MKRIASSRPQFVESSQRNGGTQSPDSLHYSWRIPALPRKTYPLGGEKMGIRGKIRQKSRLYRAECIPRVQTSIFFARDLAIRPASPDDGDSARPHPGAKSSLGVSSCVDQASSATGVESAASMAFSESVFSSSSEIMVG